MPLCKIISTDCTVSNKLKIELMFYKKIYIIYLKVVERERARVERALWLLHTVQMAEIWPKWSHETEASAGSPMYRETWRHLFSQAQLRELDGKLGSLNQPSSMESGHHRRWLTLLYYNASIPLNVFIIVIFFKSSSISYSWDT